MEQAVLPATLTVKRGEHQLGREEGGPQTTSPGWRMLDKPQRGSSAGEEGACSAVRNGVALGGGGDQC